MSGRSSIPIVTLLILLFALAPGARAADVLWGYNDSGGIYTARPIPDLNGDGVDDAVFAGYYSDGGIVLYCVSGVDGTNIWTRDYADCKGIWGVKPLAVAADVNGDGFSEVLLGTAGGYDPPGRCVIMKSGASGNTLWSWSAYQGGLNAGWIYSVKAMPDVDGDGDEEILAAAGTSGGGPGLAACVSGGAFGGLARWIFRPADAVEDIDSIEDITGDGVSEVVCTTGGNGLDRKVYCIDGASSGTVTTPVWTRTLTSDGWSMERAGDLDDDGVTDLFVGCYSTSALGALYALSGADGGEIWSHSFSADVMEIDALPDVNGDGKMEVVYGSWSTLAQCYSGADGVYLWNATVGADCWNVEAIDDINWDGRADVVAAALNGKVVKFISGLDGAILATSPTYTERIYDVEPLADVDGDGIRDVAICFQDQVAQPQCLICYKGRPESITAQTVTAAIACLPAAGTLPFTTHFTVTLGNIEPSRPATRVAARVDVQLGGGGSYTNWRSGFTNIALGGTFTTEWNQNLPAAAGLLGANVFTLLAEDVTPSPFNQPPYMPSGDTATDVCTVTGIAP